MPLFLITRPAHQAKKLSACIEERGGQCILLPTLVIQPQPSEKIAQAIARLSSVHTVIFTSANAVSPVMPYWHTLTPAPTVFAIGPATAAALSHHHICANIPPTYNSEGLLALPALQHVQHHTIVIFAGKGGRSVLKKTLQKRGAHVQKIATYARHCPKTSPDMFSIPIQPEDTGFVSSKLNNKTGGIFKGGFSFPPLNSKSYTARPPNTSRDFLRDNASIKTSILKYERYITEDAVLISTSETSLKNLWKMAGTENQAWLKMQPVVVISKKMALLAQQLGFTQPPIEAKNATDEAIMEAIMPFLLQGNG